MIYLYLAVFVAGLLLGVRIMFFGAERKRLPSKDALPLRRWEPATVAFLSVGGVAGYALLNGAVASIVVVALASIVIAILSAVLVTWVAVVTARIRPEHDPDDPRYVLQGRVGVVSVAIPPGGRGEIRYEDTDGSRTLPAREIADGALPFGEEICIERVDDGVASVERWSFVEDRL